MVHEVDSLLKLSALLNSGGLVVLMFIVWYFDFKKENKRDKQHAEQIAATEKRHRESIESTKAQYEAHIRTLEKQHSELLMAYRDDRDAIIKQFAGQMQEMREMYVNNASLVKRYQEISGDMKDAYILNTQAMQGMITELRNNQFCPIVRKNGGTNGKEPSNE